MSTILTYIRVSETNARLLLKTPSLIHRFLDEDADDDTETPPPTGGFWKRLFRRPRPQSSTPAAPTSAPPALEPRPADLADEDDADKAWNAIHYLLTGSALTGPFPAGFILHGGETLGQEVVGYSLARLLSPAQVAQVDHLLGTYTRDSLHARYNGPAMDQAEVYPANWTQDEAANLDYIWHHFEHLRSFIHHTAQRNEHLLLFFN